MDSGLAGQQQQKSQVKHAQPYGTILWRHICTSHQHQPNGKQLRRDLRRGGTCHIVLERWTASTSLSNARRTLDRNTIITSTHSARQCCWLFIGTSQFVAMYDELLQTSMKERNLRRKHVSLTGHLTAMLVGQANLLSQPSFRVSCSFSPVDNA